MNSLKNHRSAFKRMTRRACLIGAAITIAGATAPVAFAQDAPSQAPSAADGRAMLEAMSPGWNLGNTLEAIGNGPGPFSSSQETAWGNPPVTQEMMDAVAEAGFKSVRIPLSWDQYADRNGNISPAWMARVKEVVGYARNAGLYVLINVHWDGGWLQPVYEGREAVDAKLANYWTQIATAFRDADDHVLFAGTNEVMVTDVYTAPTDENCEVQNGFNQIFVDTVRATGGANATRWLVVQGYNTNIDWTIACNAELPTDSASDRLMMEVHYYDPYDFTLDTKSDKWQWGAIATDRSATVPGFDEAYADAQFAKVKRTFIDNGVPVILGEYASSLREDRDREQKYRNYWDLYITYSAVRHGLIPMYWDNGYTSNHNSGLFNRGRAQLAYPATAAVITEGTKEGLKKPVE
ncbi:glycoside hydrolase family 5 protein [Stakelama tenebrarum]|uniref:Glycoside hydrolase family 5 protein n=1 Tax=Stakelama tenebrarum TaxID=2711215 RepID=A0A6G6Y5K9_9SPHN|nr:glycoside hydrolase family 5 protein [Sphingosinithalassobacter tenebrarum]QIG80205.1 glycoside hydrolase family 5 protein [Sphingosinithalassobacter tenebrarum]